MLLTKEAYIEADRRFLFGMTILRLNSDAILRPVTAHVKLPMNPARYGPLEQKPNKKAVLASDERSDTRAD